MALELEQVIQRFAFDLTEFEAGISRAQQRMEQFQRNAQNLSNVRVGAGGLTGGIKQASDEIDRLRERSRRALESLQIGFRDTESSAHRLARAHRTVQEAFRTGAITQEQGVAILRRAKVSYEEAARSAGRFRDVLRNLAPLAAGQAVATAVPGIGGFALGSAAARLGGTGTQLAAAGAIAGGVGGVVGSLAIARAADNFKLLNAQIAAFLGSAEEGRRSFEELFDIAQDTGTSIDSNAILFRRLAQSQTDLNASTEDMLAFQRAIQQSMIASGTATSEAAAGTLQLSQALASGRVQGDEFRSIMENMPQVARLAARGLYEMGVAAEPTIGALNALREEGALTARDFFQAILSQQDEAARLFDQMPVTIDRAATATGNSLARLAAELGSLGPGFWTGLISSAGGFFDFLRDNLVSGKSVFADWTAAALQSLKSVGDAMKDFPGLTGLGNVLAPSTESQVSEIRDQISQLQQFIRDAQIGLDVEIEGIETIDQARSRMEELNNQITELQANKPGPIEVPVFSGGLEEIRRQLEGITSDTAEQAREAIDQIERVQQAKERGVGPSFLPGAEAQAKAFDDQIQTLTDHLQDLLRLLATDATFNVNLQVRDEGIQEAERRLFGGRERLGLGTRAGGAVDLGGAGEEAPPPDVQRARIIAPAPLSEEAFDLQAIQSARQTQILTDETGKLTVVRETAEQTARRLARSEEALAAQVEAEAKAAQEAAARARELQRAREQATERLAELPSDFAEALSELQQPLSQVDRILKGLTSGIDIELLSDEQRAALAGSVATMREQLQVAALMKLAKEEEADAAKDLLEVEQQRLETARQLREQLRPELGFARQREEAIQSIGLLEQRGEIGPEEAGRLRVKATEELRDQIPLAPEVEAQLERQRELWNTIEEAASDAGSQMAASFAEAAISGESLSEVLQRLGEDIAKLLLQTAINVPIQAGIQGIFGALAPGVGAAAASGVVSSPTTTTGVGGAGFALPIFGGPRQHGGPVDPGRSFLVGERGPELFRPKETGTIIPSSQIDAQRRPESPAPSERPGERDFEAPQMPEELRRYADPRRPRMLGEAGPEVFKPDRSGTIIPFNTATQRMQAGGHVMARRSVLTGEVDPELFMTGGQSGRRSGGDIKVEPKTEIRIVNQGMTSQVSAEPRRGSGGSQIIDVMVTDSISRLHQGGQLDGLRQQRGVRRS